MNTSIEMNFARNILTSIMSSSYSIITNPFLNPIDPNKLNLKNYSNIVKEPICLNQMNAKMEMSDYLNIKEFVCDFRLMLFNCYRYFGCDSKMGKLATKLESMFEQKLILLPIDIRVKTSLDAILMDDTQSEIAESGMLRRRCTDRAFSTDIRLVTPIKAILDEMEKFGTISSMFSDNTEFQHDPMNFLIVKFRKWQDKRRHQQFIRTFDEWFMGNVSEIDYQTLNNCPELIQFVQFISAAFQGLGLDLMLEEHLKLTHITIEDLEYALLFPRSSRLLCALVPLITTASKNRQSIIKHGLYDYDSWNKELSERIRFLYKLWNDRQFSNQPEVFVRRYSVDPILFKVLGNRKPITDRKQFHEISVFQRCHVLLAMCCMSLRLQDTIHFGMDKSIEWNDHRVVLLAEIGGYEYVNFGGLGEFASYFIFRIETRKIDDELAQYSVQDSVKIDKRKKKEKPIDKYRMPTWYIDEMKKSKTKKAKATSNNKRNKSMENDLKGTSIGWGTRSKRLTENESVSNISCDAVKLESKIVDITTDKSPEEIKTENLPSEGTSMSIIDDDDGLDTGNYQEAEGEEEEEDDIPEVIAPKDGELKLIARDLSGVMAFKNEIQEIIDSEKFNEQDREGYETLMKNLCKIQQFFEVNEANRKEKCNQSRLKLRLEVDAFENKEKQSTIINKEEKSFSKSDTKDSYSEFESDSSSESEFTALSKQGATRAERLARRQKRKFIDVDINPPKRLKLESSMENNYVRPPENQPITPQQVKKKVYRICDDYFTEDLEPVQINEDGTLLHLSRELISNDRYELARKMIAMYKLKNNAIMSPTQNGATRPLVSSS